MRKITKTEDVRAKEIALLKKEYLKRFELNTPDEIKENKIFLLDNPSSFKLHLTKDLIEKWQLREWLASYRKDALVSTGGVRGTQNILYPWDTRFKLNHLGVALATLGKAEVLKEDIKKRVIHKICAGEVRYNTDEYTEIIARIQAAEGIITHVPLEKQKTSIWMTSFFLFMNDYDGGEYVTSSHAISSKIATKDLDKEGSQFVPLMSARFVKKITEILDIAEKKGYDIEFAEKNSPMIVEDFDGTNLYVDYLLKGVATNANLKLIKDAIKNGQKKSEKNSKINIKDRKNHDDNFEILFECLGGCMYGVMLPIMKKLEIEDAFAWNNIEFDPFFHGVGKTMLNPVTKKKEFFDYGCDTTIKDVVLTLGYEKLLAKKKPGYFIIMVDPDGDRIVLAQIESSKKKKMLESLGVEYTELDKNRVLAYYTPNQAFLMIMDFHAKQLKAAGLWEKHPRFIITTTASAATWAEWANKMGVKVIYTPVGFKEIASIMKKIEAKIAKSPTKDVVINDIFGNTINLGVQPRLLFAGEESGGMITGPEEIIRSRGGRAALAMREKSAGEASVIVTALAAKLHLEKKLLSDYLQQVFDEQGTMKRYDIRKEVRFYNESEPDPIKLKEDMKKGEALRDLTDNFFLSIALAVRLKKITVSQAKEILFEALPNLNFDNLLNVFFVGDGTYFEFSNKYVEIRKSGTDAIIKSYSAGNDKTECVKYSNAIAGYSGALTPLFKKYISDKLYNTCREKAHEILTDFQKE
jgi:phosphomannomutase